MSYRNLDQLDKLSRTRGKGEPRGNDDRFKADYPMFGQVGRYGATRYTPSVRSDQYGRVFVYWYDQISIDEYDEMRMDGQIRAGLNLKKLPIQRAKWNVTCQDEDIAAFITEVLKPIWPELIRQSLLAMEFGHAVFEKIWHIGYGLHVTNTQGNMDAGKERVYPHALQLKRLLQLDPKTLWLLGYRWSSEFAGVRQYSPSDAVIPAEKCFLFTLNKEFGELYGVADTKPCYPYWMLGKLAQINTSLFYEFSTIPIRKVKYPTGSTKTGEDGEGNDILTENSDIALDWGVEMRNNTTIAIPSELYDRESGTPMPLWDVEFLESDRDGSDHIEWMKYLDLMKLKSLLVPQLALETGDVGAQALAETQINFFMRGEEAMAEQLMSAINEQIVAQLVKFNFGANAPKATVELMPLSDTFEQGMRDMFLETIAQGKPIPMKDGGALVPDWGWMAEFLGLPVQYLRQDELEAYMSASEQVNPTPQVLGPDGKPVQGAGGGDMPFGGGPGNMDKKAYGGGDQAPNDGTDGKYNPASYDPSEHAAELSEDRGQFIWSEGELVWVAAA